MTQLNRYRFVAVVPVEDINEARDFFNKQRYSANFHVPLIPTNGPTNIDPTHFGDLVKHITRDECDEALKFLGQLSEAYIWIMSDEVGICGCIAGRNGPEELANNWGRTLHQDELFASVGLSVKTVFLYRQSHKVQFSR